jgi:hypothetical protein
MLISYRTNYHPLVGTPLSHHQRMGLRLVLDATRWHMCR